MLSFFCRCPVIPRFILGQFIKWYWQQKRFKIALFVYLWSFPSNSLFIRKQNGSNCRFFKYNFIKLTFEHTFQLRNFPSWQKRLYNWISEKKTLFFCIQSFFGNIKNYVVFSNIFSLAFKDFLPQTRYSLDHQWRPWFVVILLKWFVVILLEWFVVILSRITTNHFRRITTNQGRHWRSRL